MFSIILITVRYRNPAATQATHCTAEDRRVRGTWRILGASVFGVNLLAVNLVDDKLFSTRMPENTELQIHTV